MRKTQQKTYNAHSRPIPKNTPNINQTISNGHPRAPHEGSKWAVCNIEHAIEAFRELRMPLQNWCWRVGAAILDAMSPSADRQLWYQIKPCAKKRLRWKTLLKNFAEKSNDIWTRRTSDFVNNMLWCKNPHILSLFLRIINKSTKIARETALKIN